MKMKVEKKRTAARCIFSLHEIRHFLVGTFWGAAEAKREEPILVEVGASVT